jgi:hypothetical protein
VQQLKQQVQSFDLEEQVKSFSAQLQEYEAEKMHVKEYVHDRKESLLVT